MRDIGDIQISELDVSKFLVSYTDQNGCSKDWYLDNTSYEIGQQGELIYKSDDYILTYYPSDNHI